MASITLSFVGASNIEVSTITTFGTFTDHVSHVRNFATVTSMYFAPIRIEYSTRASTTFLGYGKHTSLYVAGTPSSTTIEQIINQLKETYEKLHRGV